MSLENSIVDYKDHEANIEHWVKLKGEYRYEAIIDFLKDKGIECTWETVTDYVRYDKRLVINSIKYIIVLEELYKVFVKRCCKNNKCDKLVEGDKYGKRKGKPWNFETAYREFYSLGAEAAYDGVNLEAMEANQESFRIYRNKAVHNNGLIWNKYNGLFLEDILKVFIEILPESYRKGFIRDINACARDLKVEQWHIELPVSEQ